MRLLYSRDDWSYAGGFREPSLDFCLWILQVDGLRVPPFDQHPDGDGSLRAIGLNAEDWQSWFLRVIDPEQREQDINQLQQQAIAEYLNISGEPDLEHLRQRIQAEQLKISKYPLLPSPPEFHFYHACWRGNNTVRNQLIELHKQYKHASDHHEQLCADVSRAWDKEERRSGTHLYDELKPYSTRIPSLSVYFVVYDYPLDYLVFPATLLMTVQEGQPEPQEYRERVLLAAAELAARPGRRSRQSPYTRIGENVGQLTVAYGRQTRKPAPPQPAQQEIPRLTDPAKQAVLEDLSNRSFYGIVDLTTLQFLREKHRPGWKLYEVTFQEIDGVQHRMIFLSANGITLGQQQLLLTAHGHVIDNGFHVERVRLVNDAGQVLEDRVEEGYIFFACQSSQQVQLPMRAELYDHQGGLVWQQMVTIGDGLPPW